MLEQQNKEQEAEKDCGTVRGYPLVNVTCLSATLPLVNCSDYYCDNVAIKKEAHHQNEGGGLMVREMDVHRLHGSGKCIKVAIHSDPLPLAVLLQSCWLLPAILIDIHSQSILLCCRKNRRKSALGERGIGRAGGKIKSRLLMRRHKSAGSVERLYQDATAES